MFCISMVFYEIYIVTEKFLSAPVATTSHSEDSELPMISLCQFRGDHFKIGQIPPHNMTFDLYREGHFYPSSSDDTSAEEVFEKSYHDNYYLLDIKGKLSLSLGLGLMKTSQPRRMIVSWFLRPGRWKESTSERSIRRRMGSLATTGWMFLGIIQVIRELATITSVETPAKSSRESFVTFLKQKQIIVKSELAVRQKYFVSISKISCKTLPSWEVINSTWRLAEK